ncbi:hypothetical protein HMPREF1982_00165 [Clostridiales bacterium oral taxon 876 str. F0540]|nr:hypothetical protein HMPREF1982_00165 [Clostridiales bacterium oral taxon 876 str. F0540]
MSKKCCNNNYGLLDGLGFGSRKPSLSNLIILILIILQFNGNNNWLGNGNAGYQGIDNGILFIIALFYLSCCSPCKESC